MAKCTFCNQESPEYLGTFVVDSVSSKVRYYCSSKCRKNAEMKRKKRKWTIVPETKTEANIEAKK